MPIYEYVCRKCQRRFEIFQKITESPKKTCVECSGKLEKVVSQTAFHLKGTGWYATDYAKKTSEKSSTTSSPSCGKSEGDTSDSKPTPCSKAAGSAN